MSLKQHTDKIWTYDFNVDTGPVHMPVRTLVYRDSNGQILLVSPGPLSELDLDQIRDWGEVKAVVASNLRHHYWLPQTLEAFPNARFYRPEGILKKEPKLQGQGEPVENLKVAGFKDLEFVCVHGMPTLDETAFFFPTEKILFLTDLVHNIHHVPNKITRWALQAFGAWDKLATARPVKGEIKDRSALREDLDHILDWDFNELIVSHGDSIQTNAKAPLARAWSTL